MFNDIPNATKDANGSQSPFKWATFTQSRNAGNKTFICGGNMFMAELFNYPTFQKNIYMTKVEFIVHHVGNHHPSDGTGPIHHYIGTMIRYYRNECEVVNAIIAT